MGLFKKRTEDLPKSNHSLTKFSIKMLIVMILAFFIVIYMINNGFYWIIFLISSILLFLIFKKVKNNDIDEKGKKFIKITIIIASIIVLLDIYSTYRLITIETLHFEGNGIFVFLYPKLLHLTYPIVFLIAIGGYSLIWILITKIFQHRSRWIVFSVVMVFHFSVIIHNFLLNL